jgi:putative ABC transport system permease protein
MPQIAPGQACPYAEAMQTRALSAAEQRAARGDHRCDDTLYGGPSGNVLVDDGTALAALTGASADDIAAATSVLRAGGIVVRDARLFDDGRATVAVIDAAPTAVANAEASAPRMTFPAYLLTTGVRGSAIVSPGAVAKAGFASQTGFMIAATWREPTQAEEDRMLRQLGGVGTYGYIERGPLIETDARLWILVAASALITLSAAAIGTGLAAADGRADLSTLAAVGASPRLRRGLSLSQSGVIAGLGSLLGSLAGIGAAIAVLVALNQRYVDVWPGPPLLPIPVPWLSLVMALVVVPFVAILGAGLLTRSRLPIERRL